jgi:hypothetical protein
MIRTTTYRIIDDINYKQCFRCKEFLLPNTDNFYSHKAPSDRLTSWCKPCIRKYKNEKNQKIAKDKVYKNIIWTEEKIERLKKIYSTMKNKDLAEIFNTTEGSIESVACREKLKKTFKYKNKKR